MMDFYGSELSNDECEILALTRIHHTHLEAEAEAYQNKWFDYRLWPHFKASYYFAKCYEDAYRKFFLETRDKETSKRIPVFHHHDPMLSKQRTNLHLARQAFDIAGVRYDFGIGFAMRRFSARGWKAMPRTNQLYDDELIADMKEAWVSECRVRIQIPQSDYFKAENYANDLIQNQFHDWLETQINTRIHRHITIGQLVYKDKVLPKIVAINKFGSELVTRGKNDAI